MPVTKEDMEKVFAEAAQQACGSSATVTLTHLGEKAILDVTVKNNASVSDVMMRAAEAGQMTLVLRQEVLQR